MRLRVPSYLSDFRDWSEGDAMARGRLSMRKVKKILAFHFDEGRSARAIAIHCGLARRSVAQTLEQFAASGLIWLEARDLDEEVLEAALYRISRASDWPEVDWAKVEKDLAGRGMTLMLLWEEWRETHPDGMSYPTLVPPVPGMAAAPGRDDAPEPPSRRASVRRLRRHDGSTPGRGGSSTRRRCSWPRWGCRGGSTPRRR